MTPLLPSGPVVGAQVPMNCAGAADPADPNMVRPAVARAAFWALEEGEKLRQDRIESSLCQKRARGAQIRENR